MGKIHVLPEDLISKIAAGEVIERPASVIKEIIENSLDAGATAIRLEILDAGTKLIRLTDNGSGISEDDLKRVFLRHSTSKITNVADLYQIDSLGFRGEALYSIASIADVTLQSKTSENDTGFEIHIRGNEKISGKPVGMKNGSTIDIKELFFNTPARRKFLKSETTELHQIIGCFLPYTIAHPHISFSLVHNGKILFDLNPESSVIKRFARALNLDDTHLIECGQDLFPGSSVKALLGDINISKTTRDAQFIFVNSRPVNHKSIAFQANQAFRLIMPEGTNPVFAIFLKVPAENVDVNVHPSKREVKLRNDYEIAKAIRDLSEKSLIAQGKLKQAKNSLIDLSLYTEREKPSVTAETYKNLNPARQLPPAQKVFDPPLQEEAHSEKTSLIKHTLKESRFIGIFLNKYLIYETTNSLLFIDQHAAHERINFELLTRQIKEGRLEIQQLLTPLLIPLSKQELIRWEKIQAVLEQLGFSTSLWGADTLAIHSHPQLIFNATTALKNILEDDTEEEILNLNRLASRACRRSVMFGEAIGETQAVYLKEELMKCSDPFTCPHGRPTIVEISEENLKKNFLR